MPQKGERGRRCLNPEDAADANGEDLFIALTTNSTCKLNSRIERGVTIWTLRNAYERAQETFPKLRRRRRTRKQRRR